MDDGRLREGALVYGYLMQTTQDVESNPSAFLQFGKLHFCNSATRLFCNTDACRGSEIGARLCNRGLPAAQMLSD
ncbi:hypothetical protein VC279_14555 [Xanthomonas sp. WHRI 10064A]|uniref:hypothetical protein n=1 Tax=unclassified Xanthomonas TaxID=2643310 RepID=UPI002B229034|nr:MULTISPECIES: hypothetical protein [unclassified Xanthomonas]MEA9588166.1 hypothetical protein [Xanthomonas sp. WHRI 10064B]MEA9615888.1 hypothetical protein [Xanthomonas sp. WHRI 10064A]